MKIVALACAFPAAIAFWFRANTSPANSNGIQDPDEGDAKIQREVVVLNQDEDGAPKRSS